MAHKKYVTIDDINRHIPSFSYLTAIHFGNGYLYNSGELKRKVFCKCICGNIKDYHLSFVTTGTTKSCGCIGRWANSHGLYKHPLYMCWKNIIQRCTNPNNKDWSRYGYRGIKICDEWRYNFKYFYDWSITNGWKKGLECDRINNDGNYCPENCRFITGTKNKNRTATIKPIYNGEEKTLSEWANHFGISYYTVYTRYKRGLSLDIVFSLKKFTKNQLISKIGYNAKKQ